MNEWANYDILLSCGRLSLKNPNAICLQMLEFRIAECARLRWSF